MTTVTTVPRRVPPGEIPRLSPLEHLALLVPPPELKTVPAAHYSAMSIEALLGLKERTLNRAGHGRVVMSPGQIRTRLREMVLIETGYDLGAMEDDELLPPGLNAITRVGLQVPIQSTYFCEVRCRVGVRALHDANTRGSLVSAVWDSIPLAHRQADPRD